MTIQCFKPELKLPITLSTVYPWSGVLRQLVLDYCYAISSASGGETTQSMSKLQKEGGRGAGLLGPILDLPLVTAV